MRTDADLAERRIAEHVRKRRVGQAAGAECLDLLVQAGADPRDLRLGDPGLHTHGRDEVVDAAGRHTVHVGLHDHRVQRAVDAAAPLQQRGEERPGPQLGDLHLHITGGRGDGLGAVPVAVHGASVGALIAAGADRGAGFGLDELLQPATDQLGEHCTRISGLQCIEMGKQGRMILGHRVVCLPVESLGR